MHCSGKGKSLSFIQKLHNRELTGEVRKLSCRQQQKFFYQLPHRLVFRLCDIAPVSALASGHIFLGFTKCGQFLLSYTHSSDTDDHTLQLVHRYRLHWWLFVPYKQLKKVAEVMLFGDQDLQTTLYEEVYICVCQWPNDLSRILVYGCSMGTEEAIGGQTRRIHLTITAVPSLNGCSACYQVSTQYEEEEIAERWNSCIRFSCLQHGVTVHFNYEIVPPFPKFMPHIQMKRTGSIVLNAGNFIHVLSVSLENVEKKSVESEESCNSRRFIKQSTEESLSSNQSEFMSPSNPRLLENSQTNNLVSSDFASSTYQSVMNCSFDDDLGHNSLRISSSDIKNCSVDKDKEWEILIASVPKIDTCDIKIRDSKDKPSGSRDNFNDTEECASESSNSRADSILPGYHLEGFSPCQIGGDSHDSDDSTCPQVIEDEAGKSVRKRTFPNIINKDRVKSSVSRTQGNEYEFIDEISESNHEKLSTFRRRRLAEKKYEFSDENSENVPHYRFFRSKNLRTTASRLRPFSVPISELSVELGEAPDLLRSVYEKLLSPSSGGASPNDVLRPINQNIVSPILSPREDRLKDNYEKTEKTSKCIVDIERRYIELDDEIVSVITDIEDDELSSATGYHNALPAVVHGSGYTQMHMISNNKAEKLNIPGVLVKQVSLDVEQLCHDTAQKLCTESGKKYFFCNDYSVDIIDVCPNTGNIIALASVLMEAGNGKTKNPKAKFTCTGQPNRKIYRSTTIFSFDIERKSYRILDYFPLVEQSPYSPNTPGEDSNEPQWWQPDRIIAKKMRQDWAIPTDYHSSVKIMTNEPLITGKSFQHFMEGQHLIAIVLGEMPRD